MTADDLPANIRGMRAFVKACHAPHLEEPERFNSELAALTRRVRV